MRQQRVLAVLLVILMCSVSCAYATDDDVYDSQPSYSSPYYAGSVKSSVLKKALEELNYIRSLVGVPDNVTLNSEYTRKAQHGAVLLDVIDTLTHTPSRPADMSQEFYDLAYDATTHSNLAVGKIYVDGQALGNMTLSQSLKGYMYDSDSSNIDRLGHRRWLMNPRLKQAGFGLSKRNGYAAAYVIEEFSKKSTLTPEEYEKYLEWLKWPINDEFITWPTKKKAHPLTYFDSQTAWSVTLNNNIFESCDDNAVNVKLTRVKDSRVWTFSASHSDGYFTVTHDDGLAYDDCIIFRPDNISEYSNGETWKVNITGLTHKDGTPGNIAYSVTFSNMQTDYDNDSYYGDSNASGSGGCNSGVNVITLAGLILGIRYRSKSCAGK